MANFSLANPELIPDRVAKAAQERVDAGTYQTVIVGEVAGDKTAIVAYGKLTDGKTPDGDTVFEIGSITKTFTATLLAEAVSAGRLTLDTPLSDLLPGFKIPERNGKKITLGEVGMQYSGLPRMPSNFFPQDAANPYADYDLEKLKAFLLDYQLPRDPGAAYEYSNLGFGLLGYALAQSQHTTYEELLNTKIFEPLGMKMTSTGFSDEMRAHLAPGHNEAGKPAKSWDFGILPGCGAIHSTMNDMLFYLKANMGNQQTSLTEAMKFAQQPRQDVMKNNRIGLAWMTTEQGVIWHNGATGGYRSFIGFTGDRQKGVVILTNTENDVDDLGFAALLENAPLAPVQKSAVLPATSLDDYVGTYKLAEKFLLKITRVDDQFYAQGTGQPAFPIFPSAPNEFYAKIGDIRISFGRDDKGSVNGLVLHQHGEHPAPKLTAAEAPAAPQATVLSLEVLRDYVGQYRFEFGLLDVRLNGDQLEAQLTEQVSAPIYASAPDKFFYKIVDAQLNFERDGTGKVVAVVLHQNGQDVRGVKK